MTPSLLLLADGRFPAGAHAHSAGVESAVRAGDVVDVTTLGRYLRGRLATTGVTDAAFAAAATGVALGAGGDLVALDAEYDARVLSPRLRGISRRLGRQLHRAAAAAWDHPALHSVAALPGGPHQPLVVGAAVAAAGGAPTDAAAIAVHHLANAVTTAGVRLLGLDPIACAAVQADAAAWIAAQLADAASWAVAAPATLPGAGGTLTEILGEHHGTWDHRLFVA
jgi:urease accessory protein